MQSVVDSRYSNIAKGRRIKKAGTVGPSQSLLKGRRLETDRKRWSTSQSVQSARENDYNAELAGEVEKRFVHAGAVSL